MSTEVAKKDEIEVKLMESLEQWKEVLPECITPERFLKMSLSCVRKNFKLANAMKTPQGMNSTISCLSTLAELGLEPDGRKAHLIPFKNEVTLVIDYKGMVDLVMRSSSVAKVYADTVCENDEFEFNMGEVVKHKIDYKNDRGKPYAYWCMVVEKNGEKHCEVMAKDEVEKVRQSSFGKNSDPWTKWYDEMGKKTVFKRLTKWLRISPEVTKAIDYDDKDYKEMKNVTPVQSTPMFTKAEQPPTSEQEAIAENEQEAQEVVAEVVKSASEIIAELEKECPNKLKAFFKSTKEDPEKLKSATIKRIEKYPDSFIAKVKEMEV